MNFKSQTMRQVMLAMMQSEKAYVGADDKDEFINPDAPVIVQCGDFGYEVQSVGGDPDVPGFVIMLNEMLVCDWRVGECVKL